MSLHHADIWKAIDRLAERHGLSPSALARLAGLSPTVFNPSKRISAQRKRWPSTESIAQILQATNTSLDDFVGLTMLVAYRHTLPLLAFSSASKDGFFDERGYPTGMGWKEIRFPGLEDPHAFALEMNDQGMEPLYRQGDCLILSPLERARQGDRIVLKMKNKDILALRGF